MLKDKLVTIDPETNKVKYQTTFEIKSDKLNSVQGASTVVETLYRNKTSLEAIFRIIDKDNSGYISLDEFTEACSLIKEHMPCPMTHEQLEEICRLMDLNKDGQVDLNEFLESFRMVDPESRKKNQPCSPEPYRNEINCRPNKPPEIEDQKGQDNQETENQLKDTDKSEEQDKNSSVTVMVHSDPKEEMEQNSKNTNHKNTLQMSPVLSCRRGSQI
ncbi:unnamed protein product [Acanthoscelides obtectus]|uniref:EF-hand domain-containing protein n=1 Tax=Acanthoscelides obtectus TaxID=200917 RepID=A0A9P0LLB2_ACAOB|nr:unnamed protein product [Acanthoscelides obtectus]CAK1677937.1 Serine/threonine-protein phosphatase rdgC [Acanthoscelides obtectus]